MCEDWFLIQIPPKDKWVQLRFGDKVADERGEFLAIFFSDQDDPGWWDKMGTDYGEEPTHWRPHPFDP